MCRNQICRSEHRSASHNKDDAELEKAQLLAFFLQTTRKMAFRSDHRQSTLGRKLFVVVSLFVCIVLSVFLLGSFQSMILSSVRAYIQGEDYWSKGQKEAVISLMQYASSNSQADFQTYLNAIQAPLGDKFARIELEKPTPNMTIVYQGFTKGQINADDIPGMARMFRWFHDFSFMRVAIADWTAGDQELDNLTELADQLHAETFSDHPNPATVRRVLEEIEACDSRLTLTENHFSSTLAEGDRWTRNLLNLLTVGTSALLLVLGIGTSRHLLSSVRRSEEKYRRLFDSASDAILIIDYETGIVLEANARGAALFGIPSERLAFVPESSLFPDGEGQHYAENFRAGLSGRESHSVQLKIRRADGRSVEVDVSVRRIELDSTRRPVILAIFRDTSELKRLNRALLALSRCNQELVRAANEPELLERVCQIIVNTGGYRMTWVGFPEQDQTNSVRVAAQFGDTGGYLASVHASWADTPEGRGPVGVAIRTGETCIIHNTLKDSRFAPWAERAAEEKFLSVIALPLSGEQGMIGCLAIYSEEEDVFDAEEVAMLRELATNLAYGISTLRIRSEHERSEAEVSSLEGQLRQAQKMESLGRLAGGIAHDFNNLLTVIRGYAELALPIKPGDDGLRRKITEIMKGSDRAQALVSQLLAFSRKQILKPAVLDLNQVVMEISDLLPRLIGEHIHIEVRPGQNLRRIMADPNQMHQILLNLAVNARDAMPAGGTLRYQTENETLPVSSKFEKITEGVLLTVSDTGSGIPPELLARIFEPFFTTKERGKGTGLGLAMVYGTVSQSGGRIEVDSAPGRGTTFKIYFPATDELVSASPAENRVLPLKPAYGTILLVEDEPSLRELISDYLGVSGFTIITAANGAEGLAKAKSHKGPIHLVISDVIMPVMGGREMADRLKLSRPATPILFMSGYTDDAAIRRGVSEHRDHYLEKPFELNSLARKVSEVLNSAS
jgi:two-component system cell cycle sensor histidine kinase/response regulator CckA